ncbi:MAG: flotillin domain-containing protein, partial [Rubrivivax sp.]
SQSFTGTPMLVLAWLFGTIAAIVIVAALVIFLNHFYRKSSRDVAIIRTGFGGQRTLISGGCLALPFLHKIDEVSLRTIRIEVRRAGEKSLITEDRMRVDAELEFYVRVLPTIEGVATAAQSLGSKAFTPDGMRNLLEGRFIDAVQAVAASRSMDKLHEKRAEFVAAVSALLRDNLAQNGILLDSVSLTRMDQTAFASLDENNAFNAVGMRRLAEIIAVNRKQRAEVEADADISVRQTQLDATKRRLTLTQEEEQAQINQRLEIEKFKAGSDAEGARAREESMAASDHARIGREQDTRIREIEKQRELRRLEIESQLNSEVRKLDSAIALSIKHAEEARAQALAEVARSEVILAQEKVQTERERAVADRSREIAVKRVVEAGEVAEANAATEATVLLRRAKAEAEATCTRADAERARMLAESEGSRALIDAENALSGPLLQMKLEKYRLDRLPEIMSQMMKPVEKIDSIRIHQVTGFGSSNLGAAGDGANGAAKPPVTQVMDSILGMALQLPALKSIGDQIGIDLSGAIDASGTKGKAPPDKPA